MPRLLGAYAASARFETMPSSSSLQACWWKGGPPSVIVAVVQGRADVRQQFGQPRLALDQRQGGNILAIAMQQAERPQRCGGRLPPAP
jgi:hypothetical protein